MAPPLIVLETVLNPWDISAAINWTTVLLLVLVAGDIRALAAALASMATVAAALDTAAISYSLIEHHLFAWGRGYDAGPKPGDL
jgi:hypothetical protein